MVDGEDVDFSLGQFEVVSDDGNITFSKVTIIKPENLKPENIAKDIEVAGITGTHEGGGGGAGEIPSLNAPTATITASAAYDTIKVTNPTTNGNFATGLDYYINGELVTSESAPSQGGNVSKNVMELYNGTDGTQILGVRLTGNGFEDSEAAEFEVSMCGVTIIPENFTDNIDYPAIKGGTTYEASINNKNADGVTYLSPDITVLMGGEPCTNYEWNHDVNPLFNTVTRYLRQKGGLLKVPNVTDKLEINIPYVDTYKLAKAKITSENGKVTVLPSPYTEYATVYIDGEEHSTIQGISYEVTQTGSTSFIAQTCGAYEVFHLSNGLTAKNYALAKVTLTAPEDIKLIVNVVYWTNSYTTNYMYFSLLDANLLDSGTLDTTNIKYSLKGLSSNSVLRTVTYDVPKGEHVFYVKYLETANSTSGTNSQSTHSFILYQLCGERNISFTDYDIHTVSVICHAKDTLDSEMVSLDCQMFPLCSVSDRQLTVDNIIDSVEQIAIYIDDALVDTVNYDSSDDWSVDLTPYPYHNSSHSVYIKALGTDIDIASPTVTANLTIPTPSISIDGTTITASGIVNQAATIGVYIGDTLYNTYDYDPTTGFSVDIADGLTVLETVKSWAVEKVSGVTYGFNLNTSGYYQSANKGVANSYALCKVVFKNGKNTTIYINVNYTDLAVEKTSNSVSYWDYSGGDDMTATFNCINYAEANFDFGILSILDNTLLLSNTVDTTNVAKSFKGSSMSTVQTFAYTVPVGEHFVYVKFRKDDSGNKNNDTFQFKVVLS